MGRKKKAEVKKREIVSEFGGWKTGDLAWGKQYPKGAAVYGEILEFHPDDSYGPAVSIIDQVDGSYRTILVKSLSDKPPRGGNRLLARARAKQKK